MRRTATVEVAMSLLLCGALLTRHTPQSKVSQDSLTKAQAKAQTFSGKIVSQNGVRFVLRDDDNNVWYHLDVQEKAGKLVGKDVVVTGSFDGLTGTIRVQSIVEGRPPQKPPANTEEMKQESEPAKSTVVTPPVSADAVAANAPPATPAREPDGKAPTPQLDPRIAAESATLQPAQTELSGSREREASPPFVLILPN